MRKFVFLFVLASLACTLQTRIPFELPTGSPSAKKVPTTATAAESTCRESVTAEHLNLRTCAATYCAGKAVLDKGQLVTIRESQGSWYFVDGHKAGDYFYGWVHSAYVEDCLNGIE